jgi:hypothetical protein
MARSDTGRLSQSTCTRWSTYSVMLMRTTVGATSLSRGYVPPRLARADARSAAALPVRRCHLRVWGSPRAG